MKFDRTKMIEQLRQVVQRLHYPPELMLVSINRYVAYPLSFHYIEEMMTERGVFVDHPTLHRKTTKMWPVGLSWRIDEIYVKVGGQWTTHRRAVDRDGHKVGFAAR